MTNTFIAGLLAIFMFESCLSMQPSEYPIVVLQPEYNGQKMGAEAKTYSILEVDSIVVDLGNLVDKTTLLLLETPSNFYWVKYNAGKGQKIILSRNTLACDEGIEPFDKFVEGQYFIAVGNQDKDYNSPRHIATSFVCELLVE